MRERVPDQQSGRPITIGVAVLILVLLAILVLALSPLFDLFRDREALQAFLARQGPWAPVALIVLQIAQVIAAPIPGHLLAIASGWLFGLWKGALYTVVGVGAGSAIVLVMARTFGRPVAARLVAASALERIDRWAAQRGALFFFLVFLLPFLPDDLACFAVGLSPLPLLPMLGLIVLARLPGHIISAWMGVNAERVSPVAWIALGAVAVAVLLLYLRYRVPIEAFMLRRLERRER